MTTELIVREANGADSSRVIEFLNKVGTESNFLTIDEVGILISEAEMTDFLNQQAEKDNNAYFLAFVGDEIAGILHLTADIIIEYVILRNFLSLCQKIIKAMALGRFY